MANPIDFYFDFSSPYGYLASLRIDGIAATHGRDVIWRPYLMGAAMKLTGSTPLINRPLVGDYARLDILRSARRYDVSITIPSKFPVASVAACRGFYYLTGSEPDRAKHFALSVYAAYFSQNRDISSHTVVSEIAAECGADPTSFAAALSDSAIKERLRRETDGAIEAGVFGSPYFIVDNQPFWGNDRLSELDEWLESGGW